MGNRRPPAWLAALAFVLLAGSESQLAYALHPRKGPFIGYLEVVAVVALLAWGWWVLEAKGLRRVPWPPWPAWAFVGVAGLSLSQAVSLASGLVEVAQYFLYFVLLYAFFCDVLRECPVLIGYGGLATGALLALAVAGVQRLGGAEAMRVAGLAVDRNVHSAYLAAVLPLVFAGAWGLGHDGRWRWLLAGLAGVAALVMLGPPHIWILLVAVVAVAGMVLEQRWWPAALPVVAVVILVNLLAPLNRACNFDECLNPWETGNVYKLLREAGADESLRLVKKRWLEWYPALAVMADNPLLGVGAGNYQANIGRAEYWAYLPNAKKTEPNTNNLYLVVGASLGYAGLASLVALLVHFVGLAGQAGAAGAPQRWLAVGVAASLASLAVANLFTPLLVRGPGVAWAGLMALATVLSQRAERVETGGDL
jgi:MFS family permease